MSNCAVDLQKVSDLPTPLAVPCYRFVQESHPVVKLQRLIDCFEVILKYSTSIAVQSFFAEGMEKRSEKTARLILEKIQRPSLGNYAEILREACEQFGSAKSNPFIACVKHFGNLQQTERLLALRNDFKGHGATVDEKLAEQTLTNYWADFVTLLEAATSLGKLPLHVIIKPGLNGSWVTRHLQGYSVGTQSDEILPAAALQVGHLVVSDPESGKVLDLHPLLLLNDDGNGRTSPLFFNSKKHKAIFFLDYEFGQHREFPSPAAVELCFESSFPRPPAENLPLCKVELVADWFSELIGTATEHFVGRENELSRLEIFSAGGPKSVLVVTGPPGVGKTSLLEDLMEFRSKRLPPRRDCPELLSFAPMELQPHFPVDTDARCSDNHRHPVLVLRIGEF